MSVIDGGREGTGRAKRGGCVLVRNDDTWAENGDERLKIFGWDYEMEDVAAGELLPQDRRLLWMVPAGEGIAVMYENSRL